MRLEDGKRELREGSALGSMFEGSNLNKRSRAEENYLVYRRRYVDDDDG